MTVLNFAFLKLLFFSSVKTLFKFLLEFFSGPEYRADLTPW